jgi:hypothetical protein
LVWYYRKGEKRQKNNGDRVFYSLKNHQAMNSKKRWTRARGRGGKRGKTRRVKND